MPRKYIKKTPGRSLISEEQILAAKKLIDKGKSKRFAADFVGINEATLRKRLKLNHVPTSLGRFKPTFTKDQEAEFAVHCQAMDERFFGITINDLRRLAYEFAVANKLEHRFDDSSRMAGRDWVEGFLKRNEHLGLRQSAPISLARAIGFNKAQVEKFYKNLKDLYNKYKFRPNRIYNMDETGMSTVPKKTPKVIARRGKKVVGKIVSAERGMTITAVMCMSATGHFVPPALIFPRKRPKAELLDGAPTESICMVSDSGFINTTLFVNWLHHFKDFVHPSQEDPVLLILDNHSSHISLEASNYARQHHIVMLTIPPHGSHKIQPLDVAVHSPLKTKYSIGCEKWMNRNPGRGITQYQVAGLFNNAYQYVATIANAESGFRVTGIYPYADDLFDETDFAPSTVTDQNPSNDTGEPSRGPIQSHETGEASMGPTPPNDTGEVSRRPADEGIVDATGDHNLIQQTYVLNDITQYLNQRVNIEQLSQFTGNEHRNKRTSNENTTCPESLSAIGAFDKVRKRDDAKEDIEKNEKTRKSNKTVSVSQKKGSSDKETSLNSQMVTVAELSPLPRMIEKKKRTRISLKSEVITSSIYNKQLKEKRKIEEEKKLKARRLNQVIFDDPSGSQKRSH